MNFEKMTERLQNILTKAIQFAQERSNSELSTEHIFKIMNEDDGIQSLWERLNVDYHTIDMIVNEYLAKLPTVTNSNININRLVKEGYSLAEKWSKNQQENYMSSVSLLIGLLENKSEVSKKINATFGLTTEKITKAELERRNNQIIINNL